MKRSTLTASIAALSLASIVLVGCSTDGAESTPEEPETPESQDIEIDETAAALLPEEYADGINVAMDVPYEPMEYLDADGNLIGFDVDLAKALGAKLGVEVTLEDQAFDTMIPSLESGAHDIIIASMLVTASRVEAIDMIDYLIQGGLIIVPAGNPDGVTGLSDLCGTSVAIQKGSAYVTTIGEYSAEECGETPMTIEEFGASTDSQSALRAGRVTAIITNAIPALQVAKTAGDGAYFDVVIADEAPQGYFPAGIGIGILKDDAELTAALQAALQSLIDDGSYADLLDAWGLGEFGVETPTLNSAAS